jgi:tetratricopeptide (TPR) repeat protein
VFLHVNKAYDRLRGAFAKEDRAGGPALGARDGWLVVADMGRGSPSIPPPPEDESAYASVQVFHAPAGAAPEEEGEIAFTTSVRMKALTAEDLFQAEEEKEKPAAPKAADGEKPLAQTSYVEEGQTLLTAGRHREACERFAAALRVDPRNRVVRALYHVANGLDLRGRGEGTKAQEQLELALKHDPQCEEARRALAAHAAEKEKKGLFKKLFDKPR